MARSEFEDDLALAIVCSVIATLTLVVFIFIARKVCLDHWQGIERGFEDASAKYFRYVCEGNPIE